MEEYDVIVVGGGPSGSVCARLTAEKGARVLLLDKASFPKDKPSRDLCLTGQSRAILESLGLVSRLESKPHSKIRGVCFTSPNGKSFSQRLSASENGETHGWGIKSTFLDNILFEHASKVCEFREKTHVVGLLKEGDRVVGVRVADLSTKETKTITSNIVVGADGPASTVAQQLNAYDAPPAHTLSCVRGYYENVSALTDEAEMHFLSNGVRSRVWITPLENNTCNTGLSVRLADAQKNNVHIPTLFEKILASEKFSSCFKEAKLMGALDTWTHTLSTHACKRSFPGALLVGDAASLSDSFSGDGLGNQLLSGKLASEVIMHAIEKNDFSALALSEYENQLKKYLENDLAHAQQVHTLASFSPALDFAFARAANRPALREHLTRSFVFEKPLVEKMSPLSFAKLLLV